MFPTYIPKHTKKMTKQSIKNYHQVFTKRKYDTTLLHVTDSKFEIVTFMNQFTQNKLPSRFCHYFSHPFDIHTQSTRHWSAKNISLPRFSSVKTQRSTKYVGTKIWNNIPLYLKQLPYNKFKFSYKQLLLNQCDY